MSHPLLLAFLRYLVVTYMALGLYVVEVAPTMLIQVVPPSVLYSQPYSRVPLPPDALDVLVVAEGS